MSAGAQPSWTGAHNNHVPVVVQVLCPRGYDVAVLCSIVLVAVVAAVVALAHTAPFPFLLEAFKPSRSLWRVRPARRAADALSDVRRRSQRGVDTAAPRRAARTGTRATFFLIDEHITADTEPIVRRIADEGHAIGLHSGTRRLMVTSPDALAARLPRAAERIEGITGARRAGCSVRTPGGAARRCITGLDRAGYRLAGWSWGMWDWDWWRGRAPIASRRRLARKASPGDIIVIHDGHHKDAASIDGMPRRPFVFWFLRFT